jgi:hypothetical protein
MGKITYLMLFYLLFTEKQLIVNFEIGIIFTD